MQTNMHTILFSGEQWNGSDAAGLARAFHRLGHAVYIVDDDRFFPAGNSVAMRAIRRLFGRTFSRELNAAILKVGHQLHPELAVIYKGTHVRPETIRGLQELGVYTSVFYPDFSILGCGPNIPACLPLYDWVFTTKSFGMKDLREKLNVTRASLVHHGFDPELHRPMPSCNTAVRQTLSSDCTFIGTWSPRNEAYLSYVAEHIPPGKRLRIWGEQWSKCKPSPVCGVIEGTEIVGDAYSLAIQSSKINIALLRHAWGGSTSGDLVTARTFQIPACGGFMLHQRTDEVQEFYREGEEMACFDSPEELVDKIKYYLMHEDERERIRLAGHRRCVAENSLERRAQQVIDWFRRQRAPSASPVGPTELPTS